jgi:hypothetical protein
MPAKVPDGQYDDENDEDYFQHFGDLPFPGSVA